MNKAFTTIIQEIQNSPFFGTLTVLSFFLSVYGTWLAYKSITRKEITVLKAENKNLLEKPLMVKNEIKIILKDIEIEALNYCEIVIINTGNTVISNSDFYKLPRITFILNIKLISIIAEANKEYIKPVINNDNNSIIQLSFNYLEKNDSVKIKVLYSSEMPSQAFVESTIIGGKQVRGGISDDYTSSLYRNGNTIGKFSYMLSTVLIMSACMVIINTSKKYFSIPSEIQILLQITCAIISIIAGLLIGTKVKEFILFNSYQKYLTNLTNKDLLNPLLKEDLNKI